MTETIIYNNFIIFITLNDNNIYLKIVEKNDTNNYEETLDLNKFKQKKIYFEINEIYDIIKKCIICEENYGLLLNLSETSLKLLFNGKVGGIIAFNFELELKKTVFEINSQNDLIRFLNNKIDSYVETINNQKILNDINIKTLNKQKEEINNFVEIINNQKAEINNLKNEINKNIYTTVYFQNGINYDINSSEIECNTLHHSDIQKIKLFKNLNKLTMNPIRNEYINILHNDNLEILNLNESGGVDNYYFIDCFTNLKKMAINITSSIEQLEAFKLFIEKSTQLIKINELKFNDNGMCVRRNIESFIPFLRNYCLKHDICLTILSNKHARFD
jgi:hypothetical protein